MADERVQRRLAAILAADVVGYSRLMRADEAGTLARLKTLRDELLDPKAEAYGGRIVKTTGDGSLIEFPSAVDAVQCAVDIQQANARRNSTTPDDSRIELRIGINLGDVIVEGDDIYGDGVNVASRLEGLAEPGGICASLLVRESVRHKLDVVFVDKGEQSVKNIADPVHVFAIELDQVGNGTDIAVPSDALFQRPAVAVLPFENLSRDPDQEYFADGLTEDIITALSLWRSFPVIARNSTFAYKGTSPDVRKVGQELGARYVVEGGVRKAGKRVRVTAQLINAETGHHVWAERYDRNLNDIFDLQDELTEQIAAIVAPELERAEQRRLIALKPANDHAWDCLQRGIAQFHLFTKEGNEIAKQLFERAIELDPNYSQAYGWLTYSLMRDYWLGYTDRREETKDRFIFAGRRAVSLDDTNPFAHSMLALAYMWSGDLEHSITESQAALALNPADHTAYAHIGHALAMKGDPKEGIRNTEKALSLNPRDPRSHVFFIHLALAHLMDGQFEDAADWANKAVQRNVEFAEGHFVLAVSLGHQGRAEEARRALEVCQRLDPDFVPKWPNSRPYLDPVQIDHCLQGLRKAGWEG